MFFFRTFERHNIQLTRGQISICLPSVHRQIRRRSAGETVIRLLRRSRGDWVMWAVAGLLAVLASTAFGSFKVTSLTPKPAFRPSIGGRLDHCSAALLAPSPTPPDSVHRVRPADIGLIAALGDSITVGKISANAPQLKIEPICYVGNSFDEGGDESLATHVTIPNILRSLNGSRLAGFSTGIGMEVEHTKLNVAVPGRRSDDFPRQAEELIKRLEQYPESQKQWKLVHMFIGTNDIMNECHIHINATTAIMYKNYLREALRMMASKMPRTIVSIVQIWNMNLTMLASEQLYRDPSRCPGFAPIGQGYVDGYRRVVDEIEKEREFESENFTVVAQHIFDDLYEPLRTKEGYLVDFLAKDIFHLSKFGNNLVAKNLWRALLSPVGSAGKRATNDQFVDTAEELECPDKDCPLIRTAANSEDCGPRNGNKNFYQSFFFSLVVIVRILFSS